MRNDKYAKELAKPKYHQRVIKDKRREEEAKQAEKEIKDAVEYARLDHATIYAT